MSMRLLHTKILLWESRTSELPKDLRCLLIISVILQYFADQMLVILHQQQATLKYYTTVYPDDEV